MRSLDQVSYPDGTNRGRSILKDSYGNPIEYDSIGDIDAGRPSRDSKNPTQYVIPGYASGILQPHELPARSAFLPEAGRTITDDRVHFIDPLTNSFQNNQPPLPGLLPPSSNNNERAVANYPIDIPRPNIDLPETPQSEVNDPLDQPLFPPADDASVSGIGQPSIDLLLPSFGQDTQLDASQGLLPPPPSGINIPRPNINAQETPIDFSNGPINQGLIPPSTNFVKASDRSDSGSTQEGTVFFDDKVVFAPKPSHGLLPPKEPTNYDLNFDFNQNISPSSTTNAPSSVINKFTGSFGGASGVLGGRPSLIAANRNDNQNPFAPSSTPTQVTSTNNQIPSARPNSNKFSGSFGGPSGIYFN